MQSNYSKSEPESPNQEPDQSPSKTQLKKEMQERQELGAAIATLSKERLAALDLPENLLDAVKEWQRIRAHEGKRRQLQYVGKLMRSIDPEPIKQAVYEQQYGSAQETLALHHLENLREQLLDDGEVGKEKLTSWAQEHPEANLQQLRQLIRQARQDVASSPEKRSGKAYRELFKFLKKWD